MVASAKTTLAKRATRQIRLALRLTRVKLVFIAILVMLISACGSIDHKMEYWESELGKHTPAGTLKSVVTGYLDGRELEHGCHRKELQCYALDRNVESYFFVTFSAVLVFTFDEEKKLKSYEINKTGDGP